MAFKNKEDMIEKMFYTVKYFKQHPEVLESFNGQTVYFLDHGKWFWGEFKNVAELDKFMTEQTFN